MQGIKKAAVWLIVTTLLSTTLSLDASAQSIEAADVGVEGASEITNYEINSQDGTITVDAQVYAVVDNANSVTSGQDDVYIAVQLPGDISADTATQVETFIDPISQNDTVVKNEASEAVRNDKIDEVQGEGYTVVETFDPDASANEAGVDYATVEAKVTETTYREVVVTNQTIAFDAGKNYENVIGAVIELQCDKPCVVVINGVIVYVQGIQNGDALIGTTVSEEDLRNDVFGDLSDQYIRDDAFAVSYEGGNIRLDLSNVDATHNQLNVSVYAINQFVKTVTDVTVNTHQYDGQNTVIYKDDDGKEYTPDASGEIQGFTRQENGTYTKEEVDSVPKYNYIAVSNKDEVRELESVDGNGMTKIDKTVNLVYLWGEWRIDDREGYKTDFDVGYTNGLLKALKLAPGNPMDQKSIPYYILNDTVCGSTGIVVETPKIKTTTVSAQNKVIDSWKSIDNTLGSQTEKGEGLGSLHLGLSGYLLYGIPGTPGGNDGNNDQNDNENNQPQQPTQPQQPAETPNDTATSAPTPYEWPDEPIAIPQTVADQGVDPRTAPGTVRAQAADAPVIIEDAPEPLGESPALSATTDQSAVEPEPDVVIDDAATPLGAIEAEADASEAVVGMDMPAVPLGDAPYTGGNGMTWVYALLMLAAAALLGGAAIAYRKAGAKA